MSEQADSRRVCVDASLVVALLLPERFSPATLVLWEQWGEDNISISAPSLLRYEVTSALYRKAFQGVIAWEDEGRVLDQFLKLEFDWDEPASLLKRAGELAKEFQRPNTYDACYLAMAESLGCPLWTGDERLYNAVRGGFELIRWVGN
jgi:predicted nucleic acid-binding protein